MTTPPRPPNKRTHRTSPKHKRGDVYVGERERHRNRATDTLVVVVDTHTTPTWLDQEGGRWATLCDDHGYVQNYRTLADARAWASNPTDWCDGCLALTKRTGSQG